MTALTEHLARHAYVGGYLTCTCGWQYPEERTHGCGEDARIVSAHAVHVEAELLAAGIVAVQLPESQSDMERHFAWGDNADVGDATVTAQAGFDKVRCYLDDGRMSAEDARELGAALLAAASVADRPTPTPGDPTP